MNPELKQRLIGAVVVTALAAIFIPMLFDDPVENNGLTVSNNLAIPTTPLNTGETSANKLPTNANPVLSAPDSGSETVIETKEEAELSAANTLPPAAEPQAEVAVIDEEPKDPTQETEFVPPSEEPVDDNETLDTGIVDEGIAPSKPAVTKKPKTKTPLAAIDDDTTAVAPKKPKTSTDTSPKPSTKVSDKTAKPTAEFSRWTIQAGTFSKKENALALMETLRKQGLPVRLDSSKGMFRLKVGPILDKKRALEMKAKVDSQKVSSLLIAE